MISLWLRPKGWSRGRTKLFPAATNSDISEQRKCQRLLQFISVRRLPSLHRDGKNPCFLSFCTTGSSSRRGLGRCSSLRSSTWSARSLGSRSGTIAVSPSRQGECSHTRMLRMHSTGWIVNNLRVNMHFFYLRPNPGHGTIEVFVVFVVVVVWIILGRSVSVGCVKEGPRGIVFLSVAKPRPWNCTCCSCCSCCWDRCFIRIKTW